MTTEAPDEGDDRLRLLLISHVLPFPGSAGQEQRVKETLLGFSAQFHVTFVTFAPEHARADVARRLGALCDRPVVLDARYARSRLVQLWHRIAAATYSARTGLKTSNYSIGHVELAPSRIAHVVEHGSFDVAFFEYWHAVAAVPGLRRAAIPCVLDMHDVLWQGLQQRLAEREYVPRSIQRWAVERYRRREERAWREFDGLVAINRDEAAYAAAHVRPTAPVFYAPMGADLDHLAYCWSPSRPPRVAYYGALGNAHNERSAMQCYHQIMPHIWSQHPDAELWLVGSKPSDALKALAADPRVTVTGFVPDVRETLSRMSVVLCPWRGTYGFRSRLIEVMAIGVPVVASPDAVAGMEFVDGADVLLAEDSPAFAAHANILLADSEAAAAVSRAARTTVDERFSLDATYGRLAAEMASWVRHRGASAE